MARRTFSTTIQEDTIAAFKEKCDADKIAYNDMLEMLMDLYLTDQISFKRSLTVNINK